MYPLSWRAATCGRCSLSASTTLDYLLSDEAQAQGAAPCGRCPRQALWDSSAWRTPATAPSSSLEGRGALWAKQNRVVRSSVLVRREPDRRAGLLRRARAVGSLAGGPQDRLPLPADPSTLAEARHSRRGDGQTAVGGSSGEHHATGTRSPRETCPTLSAAVPRWWRSSGKTFATRKARWGSRSPSTAGRSASTCSTGPSHFGSCGIAWSSSA